MFEWMPVESNVITAEGFDPETDTIYLRFKNGEEWAFRLPPTRLGRVHGARTISRRLSEQSSEVQAQFALRQLRF